MSLRYVGRTGVQRRAGPFSIFFLFLFPLSLISFIFFLQSKKSSDRACDLGPSCHATTVQSSFLFFLCTLRILFKNGSVCRLCDALYFSVLSFSTSRVC